MSETTVNNISTIDDPQLVDTDDVRSTSLEKESPEYIEEKTEQYSDNEDEDDEVDCETVVVVPDSEMYVISVNDKPHYYVRTQDEADLCMWHVARNLVNLSPNFTTRYVKVGINELHIERQCNWYVMSYAETIHRLSYCAIYGINTSQSEKEKEE